VRGRWCSCACWTACQLALASRRGTRAGVEGRGRHWRRRRLLLHCRRLVVGLDWLQAAEGLWGARRAADWLRLGGWCARRPGPGGSCSQGSAALERHLGRLGRCCCCCCSLAAGPLQHLGARLLVKPGPAPAPAACARRDGRARGRLQECRCTWLGLRRESFRLAAAALEVIASPAQKRQHYGAVPAVLCCIPALPCGFEPHVLVCRCQRPERGVLPVS
jgi:hypothetical protein